MLDFGDQVVTVVNQSKSVPGTYVFLRYPFASFVPLRTGILWGFESVGREGEYVVVVVVFFAFVFIEL